MSFNPPQDRQAKSGLAQLISLVAFLSFPALLLWLAAVRADSKLAYIFALKEQGLVEHLTVVAFLAAFAFAGIAARHCQGLDKVFFAAVTTACFLAAGEEASWGQHLLGFESPQWFISYNGQNETNLHNVFQRATHVRTKTVSAYVVFIAGVLLPWAAGRCKLLNDTLRSWGIRVPPQEFIAPLAVATLLFSDRPSGHEEELAECFAALVLMFWMALEAHELHAAGNSNPAS